MKKLLILLTVLFLLAGCASPSNPTTPSTEPSTSSTENAPASSSTNSTAPTESTAATDPQATTNPEPVGFSLYSPNENLDGFNQQQVTIDSLRAELIIQLLIENDVLEADVQANSATVEENMLHLDLNEAFLLQINSMGTTGEHMLMGSLVNTFLSAYACESMMITVDGQIIHSGHIDYDFPLTPYN